MCVFDLPFWQNFAADFLSTLFAALIVGGPIAWFVTHSKHIDLRIVGYWAQYSPTQLEIKFTLVNRGDVSFAPNEIYWHLLLDSTIKILPGSLQAGDTNVRPTPTRILNKNITKFNGLYKGPLFSSNDNLVFRAVIDTPQDTQLPMYFALSTSKGWLPKHKPFQQLLSQQWGPIFIGLVSGVLVFVLGTSIFQRTLGDTMGLLMAIGVGIVVASWIGLIASVLLDMLRRVLNRQKEPTTSVAKVDLVPNEFSDIPDDIQQMFKELGDGIDIDGSLPPPSKAVP